MRFVAWKSPSMEPEPSGRISRKDAKEQRSKGAKEQRSKGAKNFLLAPLRLCARSLGARQALDFGPVFAAKAGPLQVQPRRVELGLIAQGSIELLGGHEAPGGDLGAVHPRLAGCLAGEHP